MAFYVSAENRGRRQLVLGPFRTHGEAARYVTRTARTARQTFRDVDHFDTAWGTARHRTGHPSTPVTQAMARALGLEVDASGYIGAGLP